MGFILVFMIRAVVDTAVVRAVADEVMVDIIETRLCPINLQSEANHSYYHVNENERVLSALLFVFKNDFRRHYIKKFI